MTRGAFFVSIGLSAAGFLALIAAPADAAEGVRTGLALCAHTILPALLPFLMLSGLLAALGVPQLLARPLGTVMRALFSLPGAAAAPLLLGLTGGYPVGAAAAAELTRRGVLTRDEGERLLPLCNNTGPAFIIGAAGSAVFGAARIGLLLYLSHILAALAVGLLLSRGLRRRAAPEPAAELRCIRFSAALTGAVKGAVTAALQLCGFVLLFSVLRALLEARGVLSALAGALCVRTGLELRFVRAALTGVLELGGGIAALQGLPPTPGNLALCSFLLGFGSLSVHCQTLAAVADAELKTARHFAGRLLHGCVSALITYELFTRLRI
jgi:sporulation integral membrane protein YlbJ